MTAALSYPPRDNHLMVLHVHKELTDNLDFKSLFNEFVRRVNTSRVVGTNQ